MYFTGLGKMRGHKHSLGNVRTDGVHPMVVEKHGAFSPLEAFGKCRLETFFVGEIVVFSADLTQRKKAA